MSQTHGREAPYARPHAVERATTEARQWVSARERTRSTSKSVRGKLFAILAWEYLCAFWHRAVSHRSRSTELSL